MKTFFFSFITLIALSAVQASPVLRTCRDRQGVIRAKVMSAFGEAPWAVWPVGMEVKWRGVAVSTPLALQQFELENRGHAVVFGANADVIVVIDGNGDVVSWNCGF